MANEEMPDMPLFYVLNPNLPDSKMESVRNFLRITLPDLAIVTTYSDSNMALQFANNVCISTSEDAEILAKKLSKETSRTLLVIGETQGEMLDAVYQDGRREMVTNA